MEDRASAALHHGHHVVQELMVDDVGNEVTRHPRLVQHGVHSHEALDGAVASELDALSRSRTLTLGAPTPRDENVRQRTAKVLGVELAEDRHQVVDLAACLERTGDGTRGSDAMQVLVDVL